MMFAFSVLQVSNFSGLTCILDENCVPRELLPCVGFTLRVRSLPGTVPSVSRLSHQIRPWLLIIQCLFDLTVG